jgi:hypothetical protein
MGDSIVIGSGDEQCHLSFIIDFWGKDGDFIFYKR